MRQIYCFFLFFSCLHTLFAQGNTLLLGNIKNNIPDFIRLQIDRKYLDLSSIEYTTLVNEEGKFGYSTYMKAAQLVQLQYAKNKINLFLSPLDSLHINIEHTNNQSPVFHFSGNSHAVLNNTMLKDFYERYPKDTIIFNYKNYKRGIFYYEIQEEMDRKMQQISPIDFLNNIENIRAEQLNFLNSKNGFSKEFYNYMIAEINYNFYYHYLAYAHIYKGRWQLNINDFLSPLLEKEKELFNNDYIHNTNYRRFVLAYTYFKSESENKKHDNAYLQWYFTANSLLTEITQPLILAQIVDLALRKENPTIVKEIYEDFLKNNPYIEFDKLVSQGMQKIQSLPLGKIPANFKLMDINGNMVALADFKGKIIYLDFWASWCRPCLEKLEGLETLKTQLADKNIVFLHINLDKDTNIWQKTLNEKSFTGIHLFRDALHEVEKLYDVYSVPKYFIINNKGVLSFTPSSTNLSDIQKAILDLLSQTP